MSPNFEYIAVVLDDYCDMQTGGFIPTANRYPVADVQEQIALLEPAQHLVDLAQGHRDACILWEQTLMLAVGEDGPSDVVKAIDAIKAERDTAWQELREIRDAISANAEESTADEVRRLKAERDELTAQLVAVKEGGGTGQSPCAKFCESVALGKDYRLLRADREKLQDELIDMMNQRDALVAQAAAFSSAQSALRDLTNELIDHLRYNKAERGEVLDAFWNKLDAIKYVPNTPQQCLRGIEAKAGGEGFLEGIRLRSKGPCNDWQAAVEQYAAKVRQGG